MHNGLNTNKPINEAEYLPVSAPTPSLSFSPVVLKVPGRAADLQMRVAAPATGNDLPIILLSHGHGESNYLSSLRGCSPLVDFYAAHGFVVIQPTHLDSTTLGVDPTGPEGGLFWRSRVADMHVILDRLDEIIDVVPGLRGRVDGARIAAVGYSLGGHTAAMLAGMRVADGGKEVNLADARINAAVLLAPPGNGSDLSAAAAEHYPVLRTSNFATMTMPALVVAGDKDINPRFSEKPAWRSDAYFLSPAHKCLLTLFDAQHSQGGISGYDARETTDENTERAGVVARMTWAYLRTALDPEDPAWSNARVALADRPNPLGSVQCK